MANLSDDDVDKIADKVFGKIDSTLRSFWIEPEKHYESHRRLDDLLEVWKETKNSALKAVIGLFILGLIAVSAFPIIFKK